MIVNARSVVEENPYGILSPATDNARLTSEEWIRGVEYWTPACAAQHSLTDTCETVTDGPYDSQGQENDPTEFMKEYTPFDIITKVQCSTMGTTQKELDQLVIGQAELALQFNIEREFWNGVVSTSNGNDYLEPDGTPISVTNYEPDVALAILEQSLSGVSNPTIHMPRAIAVRSRIRPDKEGVMRTRTGARVVIGDGYNGTATGDESDGIYAMVGTGPVVVRYGTPQLLDMDFGQLNRNTISATVVTPAAVFWTDCRHSVINVDITK